MTDTNVAVQLGNNPFTVIDGNKPVKFNQDGSVCKIHNNKKKGVSSEVYAFKSMDEIKAMIDELDRKISTAKLDGERQLAILDLDDLNIHFLSLLQNNSRMFDPLMCDL